MADDRLKELIDKEVPDLEPSIVNGYAVKEMRFAEQYVDEVLRCASESFPPGLVYEDPGYQRLLPHMEYIKATETRSGKMSFDVARSDRYMVAYHFSYNGERITREIYLPYVRDGGLMNLKGATFSVSPVLADKGISFGTNSAFVQVLRSKMTFSRHAHTFIANGITTNTFVVSGRLHHRNEKKAEENGAPGLKGTNTSNMHYLFAKYGLHQAFAMFNNTKIVIGPPSEVNSANYPSEYVDEDTGEVENGWVVCQSAGFQPTAIKRKNWYPPKMRIAVREEDFCDSVIRSAIAGFFYIADHFPERIDQMTPEEFDGTEDEIRVWRIMLGRIIGGVSGGDGEIVRDMNAHFDSLDRYIDEKTRRDLLKGDIEVDNLYDLVAQLQERLSQYVVQESDAISSMADKQLMVLRYVLSDINDKIFWMLFNLNNKIAQNKGLTINDVRKTISRQLSSDMIMKLRNGGRHGEVQGVSSPGDNKFFKITRNVVLQTDSSGSSRRTKKAPTDESKYLHATQLEFGSPTVLPKSEPTGRQISPTTRVNDDGCLIGREEFIPIISAIDAKIRR